MGCIAAKACIDIDEKNGTEPCSQFGGVRGRIELAEPLACPDQDVTTTNVTQECN